MPFTVRLCCVLMGSNLSDVHQACEDLFVMLSCRHLVNPLRLDIYGNGPGVKLVNTGLGGCCI